MLNAQINRGPVSRGRKLVAAAWLLAAALPVAAMSMDTGVLSGTLRDPSGRVLPGATVRLRAIGAEAIHEAPTDATGSFQFPDIPDGEYLLSAQLPGFQLARRRIRVGPGTTPLELTLQVGTLRETVTVRSGSASEDPVTSTSRPAPAAGPCGSTEVGGNIKPPKKLRHVSPRYRQAWIDANLEGSILMQARIGLDGRVTEVEVVSPVNADLEDEAIAAVSQWEFSPTWLNCQPIEVRMFVTVSFTIDR